VVFRGAAVVGADVLAQPQQLLRCNVKAGLLEDLAAERGAEGLAGVLAAAGQEVAVLSLSAGALE
jgi:hypothetical protein